MRASHANELRNESVSVRRRECIKSTAVRAVYGSVVDSYRFLKCSTLLCRPHLILHGAQSSAVAPDDEDAMNV